jgi:hypothetical protein
MPFFLITGAAAGADRNAYVINRLQAAAAIKRAFMLDLRRERIARLGSFESDTKCPLWVCAVIRRRFPVGANPTRQPLQPEAIGAVMEVTKWLKPSISVSRIGDSASVQAVT